MKVKVFDTYQDFTKYLRSNSIANITNKYAEKLNKN